MDNHEQAARFEALRAAREDARYRRAPDEYLDCEEALAIAQKYLAFLNAG